VRRPLRLYLHGPPGIDHRAIAEALAAKVGARLLAVNLSYLINSPTDFAQILPLIFREAWFQNAILYIDGMDALRTDERTVPYQRMLDALAEDAGVTIFAGTQPWVLSGGASIGVITIPVSFPDFAERRAIWQAELASKNLALDPDVLGSLADRFHLSAAEIRNSVSAAINEARLRDAADNAPSLFSTPGTQLNQPDFFGTARAQFAHHVPNLVTRCVPKYTWDDIVLPADVATHLREICDQAKFRYIVYGEWGFGSKLSRGKDLNVLFAGPPGTGKTMAAEVIANDLALELYQIDLSQVVSKYIGDTEKNLKEIFALAERSNAILFFDEADTLFGKRSQVRDSHDR